MRRPPFAYPRAALQAQVLARLQSGMTTRAVAGLPGYPSRQTLHRWAAADPGFAQALAWTRALSAGERQGWALAAQGFDEVRAEAFLLAVRRGTPVRELVKRPEGPSRDRLDAWKRARPEFAAALAQSARFAREVHTPAWATFDQTVADRIVLRLSKGETVRQVAADPDLPGETALRRWRRRHPEFNTVLNLAKGSGHRRRMQARSACTPALTEAIAHHIIHGGSLRSAAQAVPGAPHRVTLYGWIRRHRAFAEEIARAKAFRDDMLVDRIIDADGRDGALRQRLGQVSGGAKARPR